jgi:hypothetical protein
MKTKICRICGIEKLEEEFNKCSGRKCRRTECKDCQKKINREYRIKNKNKIDEKHKEYINNHKEQYKKYAHNCYIKNKEKRQKETKKYYNSHKEQMKEYNKKYYEDNKEKIKINVKEYRNKNKENIIKKQIQYNNRKRKEDKIFKLKTNIRNMINRSFTRKMYQKNKHTEEIIGCKIEFFLKYLLKTYKENYGVEWDGIEKVHIDHIKPLKCAKTEKEVMSLCNYKNLQLLKAKDNLLKSARLKYELKGE